jgi:two-component system osmolarity sensor histidine kinase EnvZ
MTADLKRIDADRAVLLAGISHDLRTPLSRLRLGIEMLSDAHHDGLKPGMIHDIEDMDAIIGQFLDFAREGRNEVSSAVEDLNHIVSSVCERFSRTGQVIKTNLGELPFMALKPIAMQRMVTNLMDNALRYGKGEVEVTTQYIDGRAILRVLDRGPGIPDEELSRVMQPFRRLETSRSGAEGSGLGLAIVERTAHIHGGSVKLSRRAGGGLEACVELPIVVSNQDANHRNNHLPSTS